MTARRLAAASCALVVLATAACGSDEKGSSVDVGTLRSRALADVRSVAQRAGMTLQKAFLVVDSCDDQGAGSAYRATVTADYPGGGSLAASQRLVRGWQTRLGESGWGSDSRLISHNGVVVTRGGAQLTLHFVDPTAVQPPASFDYSGPCRDLEGGADAASPIHADVTTEVNSR